MTLALLLLLFADARDWPTGPRTTPPTIQSVAPLGIARGATVDLTVEGFNLGGASAIYFNEPGLKARIVQVKELPDVPEVRLGSNGTASTVDLGALPPRNQVTVEVEVSPDAAIGPVDFRLQTPLGTSPVGRFLVEPYYGESPDKEPNDTAEDAFETFLPTILVGAIAKPGDVDWYKLRVRAGEEVVFDNGATALDSRLAPVIGIYDEKQALAREFRDQDTGFAWSAPKAGVYYIRVSDAQESGSARHLYRIRMGSFPLVISAFPLGLRKGSAAEVVLNGFHVGKLMVKGEPSPEDERAVLVRPARAFNRVKLALGSDPEITGKPETIAAPVTVNGRLTEPHHDFRFHARKGEKLVVDVNAARLGSKLDSLLEVLDSAGKPVERATVRCVLETSITLRDHDSSGAGIRITSPTGFAVGDHVMVGNEIIEVEAMPRTPDDDFRFRAFGGQRITLLDTTPEAHALDEPVYKVEIHPPGARFASNGLPLAHLTYRNDDGGPGYGKDSRLHFTAPEDGDYIVRLRDVRGLTGEEYAYRLSLRHPEPDFLLSVSPRNPNVPMGGRIPVTVTALRLDDFDGPIEVSIDGLPAGISATRGTILPGQVNTVMLLSATADAMLAKAVPMQVTGRAGTLVHAANPEDRLKLIALMPKADVEMEARTRAVELTPGSSAEVAVTIRRNHAYGGRVPVEVRNPPPGVRVLDVGLNGVLINEDETQRSFRLEALPNAVPVEQPIVLTGKVETRADDQQQTSYAADPVVLRVRKR